MDSTYVRANQPKWMANYLTGKLRELLFHLSNLVAGCDDSLARFESGDLPIPRQNDVKVTASFSAFANTLQTFKDAGSKVLGGGFTWADIKGLRHGGFVLAARNASTHDGHPILDGWSDGRYFVAANIIRLDKYGKFLEISAPRVDIKTLCLEFTTDFCNYLEQAFAPLLGRPDFGGFYDIDTTIRMLSDGWFVPEEVKQMLESAREEIIKQLASVAHDPIKIFIGEVNNIQAYCRNVAG